MNNDNNFANLHAARFVAILTLYSKDIQNDKSISKISQSLKDLYLTKDIFIESDELYNEHDYHAIDENFLQILLDLVIKNDAEIIDSISINLIEKYKFERLDRVIKAILRLATCEILYCGDTPVKIIIDEYVSLTKVFYENNETGFTNKVIETIARKFRPEEIK